MVFPPVFSLGLPNFAVSVLHIERLNLRERDHWGDLDVGGRIILRWIFGTWEEVETGWSWLRIGTDGGYL